MIKQILCVLLTFFLFTVFPAEAQQPTKIRRIGYLSALDASGESARADGIRLALRELGYKDSTLPPSTDMRRVSSISFLRLPPNWSVSRPILWW